MIQRTHSPGPKVRLRRVLREEVEGKRTCVLVIGDGINAQAANLSLDQRGHWHRVMLTIWREAGGKPGELVETMSPIAIWSRLVQQWCFRHGTNSARAERMVRARVCAHFKRMESCCLKRSIYAKLLDGRLVNTISLNVDRRFLLHCGARQVRDRHARSGFLHRYFEIEGSKGRTKVWCPYGSTSVAKSIELGHSGFDKQLMAMEERRATLMDANNDWAYGFGPGLRSPKEIYFQEWRSPESWCDLILTGPLVFIGTSLPPDDWPLWWLLHQRARYFVPFTESQVNETFYITSDEVEADHIENGAAGLEIVRFKDFDSLWAFVLHSLAMAGRKRDSL
jgi:hypothetical protein